MHDIIGDILTPVTDGMSTLVCHQVNCRGVMGAGLAKQIRDKFPTVYERYRGVCLNNAESKNKYGKSVLLGKVQEVYAPGTGYMIANLFTQDGFGRDKCYTDYDALRLAFAYIAYNNRDFTVRIPLRMGCGLGGGDWNTVQGIIRDELDGKVRRVEIWNYVR